MPDPTITREEVRERLQFDAETCDHVARFHAIEGEDDAASAARHHAAIFRLALAALEDAERLDSGTIHLDGLYVRVDLRAAIDRARGADSDT